MNKNTIFKYKIFLVLIAMYFLQWISFEKLKSGAQQWGKWGEEDVSIMEWIDMDNTWLIVEVYNDLHGWVVNFNAWFKEVQNMIQGHIWITRQTITNLNLFNSSLYFVLTTNEILIWYNKLNSSHLKGKFPYMLSYNYLQEII